jgi:hypothetical protein
MPRRRPGLSQESRARIADALGQYTGTYAIEAERRREREKREREFPNQYLTPIQYIPNDEHDPSESSRVRAFRFVTSANPGEEVLGDRYGTIFVRFIKYDTPWKYTNVPLSVYEAFASTRSKGKFINSVLNNYPYGRATGDEVAAYFQGM